MPVPVPKPYKRIPFLRLLLSLITGIIVQWYLPAEPNVIIFICIVIILFLLSFNIFKPSLKYYLRALHGILLMLFLVGIGMLLLYTNDLRNNPHWYHNAYKEGDEILITLAEPLIAKPKSYKAECEVSAVKRNGQWVATKGRILVYFSKGELLNAYAGDQFLVSKNIQPIENSGNPGAFNYSRYCLFRNITGQIFLKNNDYVPVPGKGIPFAKIEIFKLRDKAIEILKKYIPGKKEAGVAEALLIGYKNDLDKSLVQSYSNTGVVHIIAISGLHLGLIYGMLILIFKRIRKSKALIIIQPIFTLFVIWMFTLIAGAVPSVTRAAVMFSFLVLGEALQRKPNTYNTLAASAFCMLIVNPFYLWDVGFQLSYAAVIGIVTFMHPVYHLIFIKNKLLNYAWKLSSITLSAQIFTLPLLLYYFHQFSNLFWLSNFVAVPLSGLILYLELGILAISFIPSLAVVIGYATSFLLHQLNSFIEAVNNLSFSVTKGIQVNFLQEMLLFLFIIGMSLYLMNKTRRALLVALSGLFFFVMIRWVKTYRSTQHDKMIVYNIPKCTAIDFISGGRVMHLGDSASIRDTFINSFFLTNARTHFRYFVERQSYINDLANPVLSFNNKKVLILNSPVLPVNANSKLNVDVVILTNNAKVNLTDIHNLIAFKTIVADGSNSLWKIHQWKRTCDSLHLPLHSVPEKGAFILNSRHRIYAATEQKNS